MSARHLFPEFPAPEIFETNYTLVTFFDHHGFQCQNRIDWIRAPKTVVVKESDRCVICFENIRGGEIGKEMPCRHSFHGECVSKWLKIHGTCPVCRFQMPVAADHYLDAYWTEDGNREFWATFTVADVADQTGGSGSSSASEPDQMGGSDSPSAYPDDEEE